jgi:hypothetical protein
VEIHKRMSQGLSESQLKALALVPKFTSVLSISGSTWIAVQVLRSKDKRSLVYHRMLFAFSIVDIIAVFGLFLTTWPMPKGTLNAFGAVGNVATCEAQGFVVQLHSALFIYNAMLSIYYCLVICRNVREEEIRRRYELYFHAIPLMFALSTSSAALGTNMYNEANLWCWIAAYPEGCLNSRKAEPDETPNCTRGDGAYIWRWAIYYVPLWLCFGIVCVGNVVVWLSVRRQEATRSKFDFARISQLRRQGMDRTASNTSSSNNLREAMRRARTSITKSVEQTTLSWQVFSQCTFYVVIFYLTHVFGSADRIYQQFNGTSPFWLLLLHCIFQPLQGFGNFLVYRRPHYLKMRRKYPEKGRLWALKQCVWEGQLREQRKPIQERLREIQVSECLSDRQRQLASLAEMEAITPLAANGQVPVQSEGENDHKFLMNIAEGDEEEDIGDTGTANGGRGN